MKKKLVLLLVAAMAAGSLAGCGNDSSGNSGSGSSDSGSAEAGDSGAVTDEEVDPRFKYDEPVTLTSYF